MLPLRYAGPPTPLHWRKQLAHQLSWSKALKIFNGQIVLNLICQENGKLTYQRTISAQGCRNLGQSSCFDDVRGATTYLASAAATAAAVVVAVVALNSIISLVGVITLAAKLSDAASKVWEVIKVGKSRPRNKFGQNFAGDESQDPVQLCPLQRI